MPEITLRPLQHADLAAAQGLSQSFGWPHRIEDWAFMHGLGRGIAAERGGALIGTAMGWPYGEDWAAIGLIGVAAAAQGKGLGRQLVERILATLGTRRVVLHATEAGLSLYTSLGFVAGGVVRQHQGAAYGAGVIPLRPGERLRPIGRSDPPVLAALDRAAVGMDRAGVLGKLLQTGSGVVLDCDGEITGFALLRRFGRGHVIGPVVAQQPEAARALIGHFLASRPGQFIRVDVPEATGLCSWLEQFGLLDAGPAIRMVRGADASAAGYFALISQAFG